MPFITVSVLRLFVCYKLIVVCAFVGIAALLAFGLLFAGAAAVAEFLFVAGGTDAAFAGVTVVGRGTGVGEFIIGCLF